MFEVVNLMDIRNNTFSALLGKMKFDADYGEGDSLAHILQVIADRRIHPDEKDAFLSFVKCDTLLKRIDGSRHGYVSAVFRVMQPDGGYTPEEIILMTVSGTRGNEFLFCTKLWQNAELNEPKGTDR